MWRHLYLGSFLDGPASRIVEWGQWLPLPWLIQSAPPKKHLDMGRRKTNTLFVIPFTGMIKPLQFLLPSVLGCLTKPAYLFWKPEIHLIPFYRDFGKGVLGSLQCDSALKRNCHHHWGPTQTTGLSLHIFFIEQRWEFYWCICLRRLHRIIHLRTERLKYYFRLFNFFGSIVIASIYLSMCLRWTGSIWALL